MRALEQALDERNKLSARYRAAKRSERERLYQHPFYGNNLRKFVATLGHFTKLEHAERMLNCVDYAAYLWLREAPEDIRHAALEAIGEREQTIRLRAGLNPIDDPVPGEPDNVFRECKRMLGL